MATTTNSPTTAPSSMTTAPSPCTTRPLPTTTLKPCSDIKGLKQKSIELLVEYQDCSHEGKIDCSHLGKLAIEAAQKVVNLTLSCGKGAYKGKNVNLQEGTRNPPVEDNGPMFGSDFRGKPPKRKHY